MKIKSFEVEENEKLGNLKLDFTKNGKIQDTIIFAGNNGCGKTTILEEMSLLTEHSKSIQLDRKKGKINAIIIFTDDELEKIKNNIMEDSRGIKEECGKLFNEMKYEIDFSKDKNSYGRFKIYSIDENGNNIELNVLNILNRGKIEDVISTFYSSANINYNLQNVSSVTAIELDRSNQSSIKTTNEIGTQIKQTFIDICSLDALDFKEWAKRNINQKIDENQIDVRLKRFKNAFKYIMEDLEFDKIETINNMKEVLFKRKEKKININDLSSGEKQIVIRGGYLLRFLKLVQGSFILLDEPELSLHPEWQKKILEFYKKLFTNEKGEQTSQIFVATHSPFIINNASRYNDKVIVLNRNTETGEVEVVDKPTYYDCDTSVYIKDAFDVSEFDKENNILFTEGKTDKKYLEKAIEIFFNNNVSFKVECIGKEEDGNAINTGCKSLDNLLKILKANENLFSKKIGLLYDCDTNKEKINEKQYFTYTLKKQEGKVYNKGIENMLKLPDDFDYDKYMEMKEKIDEYGGKHTNPNFLKVKLCEDICNSEDVESYLEDFRQVIEEIENKMTNN